MTAAESPGPPDPTPPGLDPGDRALLDTLLHEAPVAFAFYDADRRYRRINRLLAQINRLPVEAHIGRRPSEVLEPELGAAVEAMLARVLATGQVLSDADFRTTAPDTGETRHWQSQWFPARNGAGSVTGVAVLVLDVTERWRNEERLRRSAQRTERLQEATAELAAALTVDEVSRVIGAIGRSAVGACWSGVAVLDESGRRFRLLGEPPVGVDGTPIPMQELPLDLATPTSEAIRSRRPVYVGSRADLVSWLPHEHLRRWLDLTDERAWAVLPLVSAGSPVGALRLSFAEERALEHEDRVFLEALAGQCTLALERARLYEAERATAGVLARSLLPDRLPEVPGLSLAARYLPGGLHAEIGGDWYDGFVLPSGRVAVALGDVMGKGVPAAAVMGRIRSALRALALAEEAPAAVLTGLDRLVANTEPAEQIVTLVYAVVDPVTGRAVAAAAGHPPMVLRGADGRVDLLDVSPESTPLGLPMERTGRTLPLRPGDTLFGYSDGLVETRTRGISEGLTLLVDEVARRPDRPPQRLVEDVLARLVPGPGQPDDVTVLALRYDG